MNRRDLLKGMAALPLSCCFKSAMPAWGMSGCQRVLFESLKLVLAGPFMVVLLKNAAGVPQRVFAFTPKADKSEHLFAFNGNIYEDTSTYQFKLPSDGLVPADPQRLYVDSVCQSLSYPTDIVTPADVFVSFDLPVPDRIIHTGAPETATFQSSGTAQMALNHIFLYQIDHTQGGNPDPIIKMTSSPLGDVCPGPDSDTFLFEVGRDKNASGSPEDHAVDFFNKKLLHCVPNLQGKELKGISPLNIPFAFTTGRNGKPTKKNKKTGDEKLLTSTLECKSGGLVVTTQQIAMAAPASKTR